MASSDYISREAAEKAFSQPVTMSMCLTLEECKQKNAQRQIDLFVIRGLPAADVRPVVRGEYIGEADGYADGEFAYDMWSCSVCGCRYEDWDEKPTYNFCPNCGADMREES